ncbi:SseB family protein [Geobacter sp. DSM 9736]|uniref:SseB family protein n=1 Tax=Geobacter sp. DSM 9736 TaxID=1277350 RepID=UPI000B503090|nr:SseB family protein [Geobacter sp. DSM 9736]SNB45241.1 SseB protein N-terminal domain-containing protein [Geobacter sp. DSM 9736]
MTELDKALEVMRANPTDNAGQSAYYDLFLNAAFWVPTLSMEQAREVAPEAAAAGEALPLVVETDGKEYLMLFDTEERMLGWTKTEVPYVQVPGHVLAEMSEPPLHWALNVGTEYSKSFVPDEIAWLREVVKQCQAEAENK